VIPETGNRSDFKHCVLDNVVAWSYTCDHVRVLDSETLEKSAVSMAEFGLCEECRNEELRQLHKIYVIKNRAHRSGEPERFQAFVDARLEFEGMFPLSKKLHRPESDFD
jgi:hypothetical protein